MRPSGLFWDQCKNLPSSNSYSHSMNEHLAFGQDSLQRHNQLYNYFSCLFFHPKENRRIAFCILSSTTFEQECSEMSAACLFEATPSQLFLHFPLKFSGMLHSFIHLDSNYNMIS